MKDKKVYTEVLIGNKDTMQCFQEIMTAYTEYKIVSEQEKTKRRSIEACEKTTIAQIESQCDVMLDYLERTFDERASNFRFLFQKVDQAIKNADSEQLTLALNSITEIAKSSPFKDLADLTQVKKSLDDPDHVWNF
ncbi:hypothetical protein [Pseudanabaena mucicola]|uniref:Uncharacterized protein n=1 Tax=Pseudanabaena mucicola FACHB-723 TaxID=2692860 RepID=A0ABR7ZXL9_9CYAN|nr:hypothetical protein [Pseudanabaena mucicola]MBD2187996.1 hypothetical protein [Pseudanabaena mucicola FACHB-723]